MKHLYVYLLIFTTSVLLSSCMFIIEEDSLCDDSTLWSSYEVGYYGHKVYDGCFIKLDYTETFSEYYCMYDYIYRRDRLVLYDKNWHERTEFENKGESYPIRNCFACQCDTQFY